MMKEGNERVRGSVDNNVFSFMYRDFLFNGVTAV